MDKVFDESGFMFDFSNSLTVYKADNTTYHDLSSVDFVVETNEYYIFIEVKNPDNKSSRKESRLKFLSELQNCIYPYKAADKYKNILLRKWVKGNDFDKPILCVYILEFQALTKSEKAKIKEKIFNRLPFTLNKPEFGSRSIFEKRFELLSIREFIEMFPEFKVVAI